MPITSGFSGFPHFTQRLLLTTSTYSFYFIFFYAKRERILRECTHGVWKRWAGIDRFAKQTRSALPQNYQQIIKNKFFDTSSVSLRLPPFSLRLGHARVLTALGLSFIPLAPLRYPLEKACSTSVSAGTFQCQHHYFDPRGSP